MKNIKSIDKSKNITKIISKSNIIKIPYKFKVSEYGRNKLKFIFICILTILEIYINIKKKSFHIFKNLKLPPQSLLNIYINAHKDFSTSLTSPIYKILCDEKVQLKKEYNLTIIETNKDNILTLKRRGYGENSKIHYIWKLYKEGKLDSKYVGFVHYRRIFSFKDNIPNIDEIFKNYDVILKRRTYFKCSIRQHYNKIHIPHFLNESVDIIRENYPEYYQFAERALRKKWGNFRNIFIMKKKDFIKWGDFVFGVLFEFDRKYNLTTDEDIRNLIIKEVKYKRLNVYYQSRLQGFLIERISNIFYRRHFRKVYEISTI